MTQSEKKAVTTAKQIALVQLRTFNKLPESIFVNGYQLILQKGEVPQYAVKNLISPSGQ